MIVFEVFHIYSIHFVANDTKESKLKTEKRKKEKRNLKFEHYCLPQR